MTEKYGLDIIELFCLTVGYYYNHIILSEQATLRCDGKYYILLSWHQCLASMSGDRLCHVWSAHIQMVYR